MTYANAPLLISSINPKPCRGFGLIELIVTTTVAAIIATMAFPSFTALINSNRLTTYSHALVTTFNYARSEAVKRNQTVVIKKTGTQWEHGWEVYVDTDNSGDFADDGDNDICEVSEDCLLKIYPALNANYTLRGDGTGSFTYTGSGLNQAAVKKHFILCNISDGDQIPQANQSKLIIVSVIGKPNIAVDSNNDNIPNTDSTADASSNITSCDPS